MCFNNYNIGTFIEKFRQVYLLWILMIMYYNFLVYCFLYSYNLTCGQNLQINYKIKTLMIINNLLKQKR